MTAHLSAPVLLLASDGDPLGWYPYCATCGRFGARCRDEAMAAEVAKAHGESA